MHANHGVKAACDDLTMIKIQTTLAQFNDRDHRLKYLKVQQLIMAIIELLNG